MRRWWLLGIGGVLFVVIVGVGLQQRQQQDLVDEIKARGVLRVGLDASFPPFETLDGAGNVVGVDPRIAHEIAADLGVTVEFANIGFDGLYDALGVGRVDVLLSGLPVDPYRTEDVRYSVNYFNAGQVLLTNQAGIQSVEDLNGQQVAVEWGSMGDMVARQLRRDMDLTIRAEPSVDQALAANVAIVDAVTALQHLQNRPDYRIVTYLSDDWYAAAVKLEDRALLNVVNQTLERLLAADQISRWLAEAP